MRARLRNLETGEIKDVPAGDDWEEWVRYVPPEGWLHCAWLE